MKKATKYLIKFILGSLYELILIAYFLWLFFDLLGDDKLF